MLLGVPPLRPGEERGGGEQPEEAPFVLGTAPDVEQRVGDVPQRSRRRLPVHGHRLTPAHRFRVHHRAVHQPEHRQHGDGGRPEQLAGPFADRREPWHADGDHRRHRREEDERREVQVEERRSSARQDPQVPPRGRFRLAQRERERPDGERHRGDVVEEPDQERLAPEQRAREERQARVGAERAQQRAQRIRVRHGDGREQDQVRPLGGAEGECQRRADQVVEQVLRLAELEREVLLRLPRRVPPMPQGGDGRYVLGKIGEGQVRGGPQRHHHRRRARAQEPGPQRVVFVGPVQGDAG